MSLIKPFRGLRPTPNFAKEVLAPPYDVLNTDEARRRAVDRPYSFLHISKPEIDLPEGTDPYSSLVYKTGASNLENQVKKNILVRDSQECYYLYRLTMGSHVQTGLVAIASVADYNTNRIRKHEFTRPKKEDDRVKQIDALNAQTGPVFLSYKHLPEMDALVTACQNAPRDYDVTADDGIRHEFWTISDGATITQITEWFDVLPALYICDGHHRSAAAARVSAQRQQQNKTDAGHAHEYFLAVLFPDSHLQILDYNRAVRDLNGLSAKAFVERVKEAFDIVPSKFAVKPATAGEFGMYLASHWYQLHINEEFAHPADPVKQLDVSLLADYLIDPILGITDPRTDDRIDFIGGIRGLKELERRVDSGEMAVAFSLYATSLSQLMAVADSNQVMPPKSTWFEPKLADGLVSHVLD